MLQQAYTPSNNGLVSIAEASADYDLAPIGIASMKKQVDRLAEFGRNGDIYIIHAGPGETVVPMEVLDANPQVKDLLFTQMRDMGMEPERYVVGNELNFINPDTGLPEFWWGGVKKFFSKAWKGVKKVFKKIAPILAPIVGNMILPGIGGILASGLVTKLQGGSWGDVLKGAAVSYLGGAAMQGFTGAGSFMSNFKQGLAAPFQALGNLPGSFEQGILGSAGAANAPGASMGDKIFRTYDPNISGGTISGGGELTATGHAGDDLLGAAADGHPGDIVAEAASPGAMRFPQQPTQQVGWLDKTVDWAKANPLTAAAGVGLGAAALGAFDPQEEVEGEDVAAAKQRFEDARIGENPLLKANEAKYTVAGLDPYAHSPASSSVPLESAAQPVAPASVAQPVASVQYASAQPVAPAAQPWQRWQPPPQQRWQRPPQRWGPPLQRRWSRYLAADGGSINGPGTGRSDDIPAMLSDGEFVLNARSVRGADPTGQGNRYRGAQNLYKMMRNFEMRG